MKTLIFISFLLFSFNLLNAQNDYLEISKKDSANLMLQASINSHYDAIDKYYQIENDIKGENVEHIKKELVDLENQKTNSLKILQKSANELSDLLVSKELISELELSSKILKDIDEKIKILDKCNKDLNSIILKTSQNNDIILKISNLDRLKKQRDIDRLEFAKLVDKLPEGDYSFIFKNERYFAFIADPIKHKITITNGSSLNKKGNRGISINRFISNPINQNNNVLMVTNGGMFKSDFSPVGLLVIDKKIINNINNEKEADNNFLMLPNGVFYIQNDSVFVSETNNYLNKEINSDFATQSGPLLLNDGKQHHKFKYGSSNIYSRSGVGILSNNRAIFVISEKQNTNFFDFSSLFKDVFFCKDALYLDGAISEMYLKNNINLKTRGGSFGSLIVVEMRNN